MDETGLYMISEIASCSFSDNHLNQVKFSPELSWFVISLFLYVDIQIVNPEGLRDQYHFMSPLCFSLTIQ